jgi:hypothetical protein
MDLSLLKVFLSSKFCCLIVNYLFPFAISKPVYIDFDDRYYVQGRRVPSLLFLCYR